MRFHAALLAATLLTLAKACKAQTATCGNTFINELHYDNRGKDAGEFVEVAGPAGADLDGWAVVAYDGENGRPYRRVALGALAPAGACSLGFFYSAVRLQNARQASGRKTKADGLALVDGSGGICEFVSYEGTLTAAAGPAQGMTSTDIGVMQRAIQVARGDSIGRTDGGAGAAAWANFEEDTRGGPNPGQCDGAPAAPVVPPAAPPATPPAVPAPGAPPPATPAPAPPTCNDIDDDFEPATCTQQGLAPPEVAQTEAATYDPRNVDWRSIVKSVEYLAGKEPRWCSFAVRSFFHDAGAFKKGGGPDGVLGADGSLLLDKLEFLQPENAYDAFNLFNRLVLAPLARHYGASFADLANVAAATCVDVLGNSVSIPGECAAAGIGLKVGKVDASFSFSKAAARERVDKLPGNFQEAPIWINFWMHEVNSNSAGPSWDLKIEEALALMGSHTLIDNQACTTDGTGDGTAAIGTAGCSGAQRIFKWSNSYFQDTNSGVCTPRNPSPQNAEWFPTSLDGAKGRAPNDAEDAAIDKCVFKSGAGAEMGQNTECVVVTAAAELDIGEIPEDADFRFVDWYPDASRAPCCGYHCQTCPGNDTEDPYYCPDSPAGTSFWFYTWQDCDLIFAARNAATYCSRSYHNNCGAYSGNLQGQLTAMKQAYDVYSKDNKAWQKSYARGHCKLANLGAVYSAPTGGEGVELTTLLDECFRPGPGGGCASDPQGGVVAPYGDACAALPLGELISGKQCDDCDLDLDEPVELPEDGSTLQPGSEQTAAGGVQVRVAAIGGA